MRANEISASGKSPLDIMSANMLYWYDRAVALSEQVRELLAAEQDASPAAADVVFKEMMIARENAQRCATDAAPFVHPRLQAIATQSLPSNETTIVKTIINNDQNDRSYRNDYRPV
jgi:hypothetical protein